MMLYVFWQQECVSPVKIQQERKINAERMSLFPKYDFIICIYHVTKYLITAKTAVFLVTKKGITLSDNQIRNDISSMLVDLFNFTVKLEGELICFIVVSQDTCCRLEQVLLKNHPLD